MSIGKSNFAMTTAPQPLSAKKSALPSTAQVALAFAAVYVLWGSTYLGIRIVVEHIPPTMMGSARFLGAGPLMLAWCWLVKRRISITKNEAWRLATIGVLLLTGGNVMVAWSEQYVPSGLAALIVAAVPLWVMVIEALSRRGERPSARGIGGLALGIVGLAVLLWPKLTSGNPLGRLELMGAAGLLFASASWALGSVFARRWQVSVDALVATAWEMTFAGVVNFTLAMVTGQIFRTVWTPRGVGAIVYLIVFGSWIGFSAYIWLLNHVPTAKVATYAYVNPVVAVLLGWLILHETVDGYVIAGTVVIVGAVFLVTSAKMKKTAEPVAAKGPLAQPELPACEQGAD
jgi:drug/metabolite transporter (DMT)-like permease